MSTGVITPYLTDGIVVQRSVFTRVVCLASSSAEAKPHKNSVHDWDETEVSMHVLWKPAKPAKALNHPPYMDKIDATGLEHTSSKLAETQRGIQDLRLVFTQSVDTQGDKQVVTTR